MKVVFIPEVKEYFLELANILYNMGYFGFVEAAVDYADTLFEDIRNNLPYKQKKNSPKYFDRYGKDVYYAVFKKNKNTSWYVFFNIYHTKGETVYFVRFVSNNHVIAKYL